MRIDRRLLTALIVLKVTYDDPPISCADMKKCTTEVKKEITVGDCVGPEPDTISPPVYVYYELTNYFQNHRRYVKSRNDDQLRWEQLIRKWVLENKY